MTRCFGTECKNCPDELPDGYNEVSYNCTWLAWNGCCDKQWSDLDFCFPNGMNKTDDIKDHCRCSCGNCGSHI